MHRDFQRRRELAIWVGGALLIAAGLWVTFNYAFAVWGLDADTAVPIALWRGVRQHGLPFLESWFYTPDNWLLSLLPVSALVYETAGVGPSTQPAIGWMIFVISVALTAWLAGKIAGAKLGLATACALVFANYDALGPVGFMAYPVTHNISMAWALVALLAALRTLERREAWATAAVAFCVFANVLSDPWATPALAAPLALASAVVAALQRRQPEGRGALLVLAATVVGQVLGATHLFGLLSFLPRSHFVFGGLAALPSNAYWVLRTAAHLFNVIPGGDPETRAFKVVNGALFVGLMTAAGAIYVLGLRRLTARQQLVVGAAGASMAAMVTAFLLGYWQLGLNVGRFFPNLYFFGALVVVGAIAALEGRRRAWGALLPGAYAVALMVSAVSSQPGLWRHPRHGGGGLHEAKALGAFLEANGLTYGYGPYWGSRALVMDIATEGRVTIRAVTFRGGAVGARRAETSRYWFATSDEPPGQRDRFLMIVNDGEECPEVAACVAMAERQLGPPARRLAYRDATILVWPHSIADRLAP